MLRRVASCCVDLRCVVLCALLYVVLCDMLRCVVVVCCVEVLMCVAVVVVWCSVKVALVLSFGVLCVVFVL